MSDRFGSAVSRMVGAQGSTSYHAVSSFYCTGRRCSRRWLWVWRCGNTGTPERPVQVPDISMSQSAQQDPYACTQRNKQPQKTCFLMTSYSKRPAAATLFRIAAGWLSGCVCSRFVTFCCHSSPGGRGGSGKDSKASVSSADCRCRVSQSWFKC